MLTFFLEAMAIAAVAFYVLIIIIITWKGFEKK